MGNLITSSHHLDQSFIHTLTGKNNFWETMCEKPGLMES